MVKYRKEAWKPFDMQPVEISLAVMFVDEGVIYKTAEAAL